MCLTLNQTLGDHVCKFCATIVPAVFADRTDYRQVRGFLTGVMSMLLFPKPAVYLSGPTRLECRGESYMQAPNLTSLFSMSCVNVVFTNQVSAVSLQRAILCPRISIVYLDFSMATLVQLNWIDPLPTTGTLSWLSKMMSSGFTTSVTRNLH